MRSAKAAPFVRKLLVAIKRACWESGAVKTPLDLSHDLMREPKGIAADKASRARIPKPLKLRSGLITTKEIEAANTSGRD